MTAVAMLKRVRRRVTSRARYSTIGVELDGRVVRAAQLRLSADGWCLWKSTEFTAPADATPSDRAMLIQDVLLRRGFEGSAVGICLPVNAFQSDLLDLSESKGKETEEAVRGMFGRAVRCSPEALEVAFWARAGAAPADAAKVFSVALTHDVARDFLRHFDDTGVDVAALGCPASALSVLTGRGLAPPSGNAYSAVVRLGYSSHLVLLCQGGQVIYQRTLDTPGWAALRAEMSVEARPQAQDPTVRRHLSGVAEETLATLECVPRTFNGASISGIHLTGVCSDEPGVLNLLACQLNGLSALPLAGISAQAGAPTFDIAFGMALGGEKA